MDSDKLNQWMSLGASIGVFIGLVFLVLELKQANDLAEASAYRSRGEEIQASLQSTALSSDFAEILVTVDTEGISALSAVESKRYQSWLQAGIFRMQNQFNDYRLGYLDDNSYRAMLAVAARRYDLWKEFDLPVDDPDFRKAIEATLLETQADQP